MSHGGKMADEAYQEPDHLAKYGTLDERVQAAAEWRSAQIAGDEPGFVDYVQANFEHVTAERDKYRDIVRRLDAIRLDAGENGDDIVDPRYLPRVVALIYEARELR